MWFWYMISCIKGGMRVKNIRKQDPEAVIRAQEGWEGEFRRFYNEEIPSSFRSPNMVGVIKSRCLRWAGHVGRIPFKILTGKSIGRPRRRWEDNIKMDLNEIGINRRNWIYSAQDRDYLSTILSATLNLRVS